VGVILPDFPRAAVTDQNPQIMTFDMFCESVVLKGDTPFSKCMYLAADCNYPIDRRKMVVGMVNLEGVLRAIFFDGLPTVKCSVRRDMNPFL
jgi:hypothetical protein